MRKVISFRATAHQVEILETAEKIYQRPACEIICAWIEQELPRCLKISIDHGAKVGTFTPPIQRRKRKDASDNPC